MEQSLSLNNCLRQVLLKGQSQRPTEWAVKDDDDDDDDGEIILKVLSAQLMYGEIGGL